MKKDFRKLTKEQFRGQLPLDLFRRVNVHMAELGLNMSEFLTLLCCDELGIDPEEYGLSPRSESASV